MDNALALDWIPQRLSISFKFGWINLGWLHPMGAFAAPPPTLTAPLDDLLGESKVLDILNTNVAFAYSCPLAAKPKTLTYLPGRIVFIASLQNHYYIDARVPLEDYLAKFSRKTVSDLERRERKVAKTCQGPYLRSFTKPEEMEEFHRQAVHISAKSYQERMLRAGVPKEDSFRDVLVERAEKGVARGFVLYVEDKPVAFNHCIMDGNVMVYNYTAFDPEYSKYSPGTLVLFAMIKSAFADPTVHFFDLFDGEYHHKKFFSSNHVMCGDVLFLRRTFGNHCLALTKLALASSTRGIKHMLRKMHLDMAVRKRVRQLFVALRG